MNPSPLGLSIMIFSQVGTFMALLAWRREIRLSRLLILMLACSSFLPFTYGAEMLVSNPATKIGWYLSRQYGTSAMTLSILLVSLAYTGHEEWLKGRRLVFTCLPMLIDLLIIATDPLHHAYSASIRVESVGSYAMVVRDYTLVLGITHALLYIYLLLSFKLLVEGLRQRAAGNSARIDLLLIGTILPLVALGSYTAGARPLGFLNLTPLAYLATGQLFFWVLRGEQRLGLSPAAHDLVVQRIRSGVIVLDNELRILELNPSAISELRTSLTTYFREPITRLLDHWPELSEAVQDLVGQPILDRFLPRQSDGRTFHLETTPLVNGVGRKLGYVLVLADITNQKANERLLQEQQSSLALLQERERLARELHDNTGQVMGYISAQVQTALKYLARGQPAKVDTILSSVSAAAQAAHSDLRTFILDLKSGESSPRLLTAAIQDLTAQFQAATGIAIHVSLPHLPIDGLLSQEAVFQLLRILQESLTNSYKHAKASQVQVLATRIDSSLQVIIADNGVGFQPEGVSSPWQDAQGNPHFGLGIIRDRAREAGGTLEVRSTPGAGTSLIVTLPVQEQQKEDISAFMDLQALIVDDHPLFRTGLRELLQSWGIAVLGEAASGEEALSQMERLTPNLVFLDIQMPGMDGIETLQKIMASHPETQVVMLTVSESESALRRSIDCGAAGYLLKDLDKDNWQEMLRMIANRERPIPPRLASRLLEDYRASEENLSNPARYKLSVQQLELLSLLASGATYQEISRKMHITVPTVKYHVNEIAEKLQVSGRLEAISTAARLGWIK